MLAEIQLSVEQKFNVLLAAFVLFLLAVLAALCLAVSFCPLNRWLHERDESSRKRRQELAVRQFRNLIQSHQLTSQQPYYTNYHNHNLRHSQRQPQQQQLSNNKCAPHLASCLGPPPAYEAALRATRLQSLTSNSLFPAPVDGAGCKEAQPNADSPDWLKTALSNHQLGAGEACERQLDLGDYFHPPKELLFAPASSHCRPQHQFNQHVAIQMGGAPTTSSAAANRPEAPVMLRLWVKLLEPDELVKWARKQKETNSGAPATASEASPGQPTERPRFPSLTRQLSIPQLFGSLMTLAAGSNEAAGRQSEPEDCDEAKVELEVDQQPSSLSSSLSSASSSSSSSAASSVSLPGGQSQSAGPSEPHLLSPERRPRRGIAYAAQMAPVRSITSRVLHMNVASFSYVKDENLISTKKHNQLNFQHFHTNPLAIRAKSTERSTSDTKSTGGKKEGQHKMCQLLVSICDIENLLGSSWLENRACLKLAQNSSIYIKCEILAAKSSGAARLLRNPLRVLTHQDSTQSGGTHTIDFGPTLPAAAIEPRPNALARATSPSRGLMEGTAPVAPASGNGSEQRSLNSLSASSASDEPAPSPAETRPTTKAAKQAGDTQRVKWRHEPAADGKAIVVFSSIPKQVAQQQQFAASTLSSRTATNSSVSMNSVAGNSLEHSSELMDHIDLIQFDSVFVSPILSKALLENGHIRLRVYAQCKYVNETCLAELKLPLRQLMRSQSRDNLADASAGGGGGEGQRVPPPQQQADFILNNLLANLVTASSGAPLTTLMEQISAEERETAEMEAMRSSSENLHPLSAGSGAGLQRSSSSPPAGPLASWLGGAAGSNSCSTSTAGMATRLEAEPTQNQLIEQNHCRSLMVSHWLNYLVAPSYECQLVEEARGKLVLGLTYLPTSNRLVFNAHRASIEQFAGGGGGGGGNGQHSSSEGHKQLVKKLRLHSDTSYLLRFIMVANGRALKRRQTACARKPEWDSLEPVTFDLVNVAVERPSFIVALVMRNPQALASAAADGQLSQTNGSSLGGSLQSLSSYHQVRPCGDSEPERNPSGRERACACQSDPESLRMAGGGGGGPCQFGGSEASHSARFGAAKQSRDLVVGHLVLADELWLELKAQPRRQLVKQFKLL